MYAMPRFLAKDEIASFEFHDSRIKDINFCGSDMVWKLFDAIVIGKSCPDIPNRVSNTLNPGNDRYAEPFLELTFQNYKIISLLRNGCWRVENDVKTEIYPPVYIEQEEHKTILPDIARDIWNTIHSMYFEVNSKRICFDLLGGKDLKYYTIELITDHVIATWDAYGKDAWYLERYHSYGKPSE